MSSLRSFFDEESDGYLYGLMRLLLGMLLIFQTSKIFGEARRHGYFGNFFHLPLLPEHFVPTESVYFALLALELAGAALAVSGYLGRTGLCIAALTGLYLLLCDRLQYHNNRFALLLVALLASLTPCDRSFLLYRGRRHALSDAARRGPSWARRLIQFQISAIYLASGGGKLLDPDWRGGQVMLPRFQASLEHLAAQGRSPPAFLRELFGAPWFSELLSTSAISLELFVALGLWFGRTRALALWAGVLFHLGIEFSARVELFSWLMGVSYVAFVTPELRERELRVDRNTGLGRAVARWVPWLDWLGRFRLTRTAPGTSSAAVAVVDRDGTAREGVGALVTLARGIPLFFVFWPLLRSVFRRKFKGL